MKHLSLLLFVFYSLTTTAQQTPASIYETEDYIVWQPSVKLTFEMFRNTNPSTSDKELMSKDHRQSLPYLGFWKILDVPKRKSGWKKGIYEQAYFCATFSKFQSCMVVRDSFDLQVAQLQWDILELGTRRSRMILDSLQTMSEKQAGMKLSGVVATYYSTAAAQGEEMYLGFSKTFLQDLLPSRNQEKLLEYRKFMDEMLENTSKYATNLEEAERLLFKKPLSSQLKQAETIIGDLR